MATSSSRTYLVQKSSDSWMVSTVSPGAPNRKNHSVFMFALPSCSAAWMTASRPKPFFSDLSVTLLALSGVHIT